ncbi:hypothetical protein RJ44_04560 [Alteromonas macleodii]|uniref:glycosyltransferase n=1 Tax=Alteromonas macleodii TaxID=28108 RepID=UPI00057C845F|nr:glycosyltransferase [Alteromonas macleodii]KHT60316.1 hypothetical protein RJ44_04560 [Alteromonas macleodii]
MKNVVFLPDYTKGNPYQNLLADALKNEGWSVEIRDYPEGTLPLQSIINRNRHLDVIHIHWITPIVAKMMWSQSKPIFLVKLFLLWLDVSLAKLRGKTVVWTIHNKFSHQQFERKKETIIRRMLFRTVNKVITHGDKATAVIANAYGISNTTKATSVLHGNYEGCYPKPSAEKDALRRELGIPANASVILCFGILRPYKGIEDIVKAVNSVGNKNIVLYIAGAVHDQNYANTLTELANENSNILLKFEFLEDQALIDALHSSDVVACPFSSTLTSGSVILAMTEGKALILPKSAEILDSVTPNGILTYSSQNQLETIVHQLDVAKLADMGVVNAKRAKEFSWQSVGKLTSKVYEK